MTICIVEALLFYFLEVMTNASFSSPELKAQVSFSDHPYSVRLSVRPSVRLSVRLSVCKLFTFSTSSQQPLGQFKPNLAQSILG